MADRAWAVVRAGETPPLERNNAILFPHVAAPEVSTETLWFATGRTEPDFATPAHTHTCETVALVTRGRARFRVGPALEEVVDCGPGDVIFVAAGVVHIEETLGDEPAEFVVARDRHGGETVTVDLGT